MLKVAQCPFCKRDAYVMDLIHRTLEEEKRLSWFQALGYKIKIVLRSQVNNKVAKCSQCPSVWEEK
jgi:hypothetical protein